MTGRIVEIGTQRFTQVICKDKPGQVDAGYEYQVVGVETGENFTEIYFQKGPVGETGVNGCHNEDLIAIVLDRLRAFQKGDYACRENAIAITKLEEALHRLNDRTADRSARGVMGTSVK